MLTAGAASPALAQERLEHPSRQRGSGDLGPRGGTRGTSGGRGGRGGSGDGGGGGILVGAGNCAYQVAGETGPSFAIVENEPTSKE